MCKLVCLPMAWLPRLKSRGMGAFAPILYCRRRRKRSLCRPVAIQPLRDGSRVRGFAASFHERFQRRKGTVARQADTADILGKYATATAFGGPTARTKMVASLPYCRRPRFVWAT